MGRQITATLIALVATACFALPLRAAMISGALTGESTLTATATPGVYVQNYTGAGTDLTLGSFISASTSNIDFSAPPAITVSGGTLTETFAQGTLTGTSSGSGNATGMGTAGITLDFVVTGGTGGFAGDTGNVMIVGTITSSSPTTETFIGTYTGSLAFLPEPSTFTLLGSALAIAAVATIFRRGRETLAGSGLAHWHG